MWGVDTSSADQALFFQHIHIQNTLIFNQIYQYLNVYQINIWQQNKYKTGHFYMNAYEKI